MEISKNPNPSEEETDAQILAEFKNMFPKLKATRNNVITVIKLPPESDRGVILNKEQRIDKALDQAVERGVLAVAVGSSVKKEDGICEGDRVLLTTGSNPSYHIDRGDFSIRILDRNYIAGFYSNIG